MTTMQSKYSFWWPTVVAIACVLGMVIGSNLKAGRQEFKMKHKNAVLNDYQASDLTLREVIQLIDNQYVDSINLDKLSTATIKHITKQLDPYSTYYSRAEAHDIMGHIEGHYYGLGIEFQMINDTLTITKVIKNSPADIVGLMELDQVLEMDQMAVSGVHLSNEQVKEKLTGMPNVPFQIAYVHNGARQEVTIQKKEISVPNIQSTQIYNDSIGYIQLVSFGEDVSEEFTQTLQQMTADSQVHHLIIDLRNNAGGFLHETVEILNHFFPNQRELVVYTEDQHHQRNEYKTIGRTMFNIQKVLIIVNENSASAAEIMAGVFQDLDRGLVIGQPTYGKGLVQEPIYLSNGSMLYLTTSSYFLPSGRSIQKLEQLDSISWISNHLVDTVQHFSIYSNKPLPSGEGIIPDLMLDTYVDSIIVNLAVDQLMTAPQ